MFLRGTCNMSGHAQEGCDGDGSPGFHMALVKDGVGFSRVPGPSDDEIAIESNELGKSRMERIVDDEMSDF